MSEITSSNSRRNFLKGAGLVGLATSLSAKPPSLSTNQPGPKAKNMIFLVVDGMCNGTLGLAHHWNLRNQGRALNRMELYDRPDLRRALQDTASNSSPVTDSAAAASAWGCGQRVNNGSINVAPNGKSLEPIYSRAKRAGKRTGLVSTCRISHATPAGFAANVEDRGNEDAIVRQYLNRRVDLLLGGGAKHFIQKSDVVGARDKDYFKLFAEAGYDVVRDRHQLKALPKKGRPVLGVFSESHIPYALDREFDVRLSRTPGLSDMLEAALGQLEGSEEGFVLQVEAGRVDHAGHANDPAAILHELLEFDHCIPIALDFIDQHPDTLLILTTDHGTGGCQLDGSGHAYSGSGPALERINQFKYSFEWLENRFRASGQFDSELFSRATGLTASAEQAAKIQIALEDPQTTYLSSKMTAIFSEQLNAISSVGWSSNKHTSECVDLMAFGPGSEQLPGFIKNNELHSLMADALKI